MSQIGKLLVAALLGTVINAANAKLPAPPPPDPAKVEAANKKKAEAAKREAEALSKAQDRAAEHYKRSMGGSTMRAETAKMPAKPKAKK